MLPAGLGVLPMKLDKGDPDVCRAGLFCPNVDPDNRGMPPLPML